MNFHKILLKFTKIRMNFQLTNFIGEFYMIFSLSESYGISCLMKNQMHVNPVVTLMIHDVRCFFYQIYYQMEKNFHQTW
jgi:hypothetical protein